MLVLKQGLIYIFILAYISSADMQKGINGVHQHSEEGYESRSDSVRIADSKQGKRHEQSEKKAKSNAEDDQTNKKRLKTTTDSTTLQSKCDQQMGNPFSTAFSKQSDAKANNEIHKVIDMKAPTTGVEPQNDLTLKQNIIDGNENSDADKTVSELDNAFTNLVYDHSGIEHLKTEKQRLPESLGFEHGKQKLTLTGFDDEEPGDSIESVYSEKPKTDSRNEPVHSDKTKADCSEESVHSDKSTAECSKESVHSDKTKADTSKESVDSDKTKADCSKESVHSDNTKADSSKESIHKDKTMADSSKESVYSDKTKADSSKESVHSEKTKTDSSKESVHSDKTKADSSKESVHSEKAKTDSSKESVHSDKTKAECSKESLHSDKTKADSSKESVHSDKTKADSSNEPVHSDKTKADSSKESVHSDKTKADSSMESVHSEKTKGDSSKESVHSDKTKTDSSKGSVHSDKPTADSSKGSVHLDKTKTDISKEPVHSDKTQADSSKESVHSDKPTPDCSKESVYSDKTKADCSKEGNHKQIEQTEEQIFSNDSNFYFLKCQQVHPKEQPSKLGGIFIKCLSNSDSKDGSIKIQKQGEKATSTGCCTCNQKAEQPIQQTSATENNDQIALIVVLIFGIISLLTNIGLMISIGRVSDRMDLLTSIFFRLEGREQHIKSERENVQTQQSLSYDVNALPENDRGKGCLKDPTNTEHKHECSIYSAISFQGGSAQRSHTQMAETIIQRKELKKLMPRPEKPSSPVPLPHILVTSKTDIQALQPSKVTFVFIDHSDGDRILGDYLRDEAIRHAMTISEAVIVVYCWDTKSKDLELGQLFSPRLEDSITDSVLLTLRKRQSFYSIYKQFTYFQQRHLINKISGIFEGKRMLATEGKRSTNSFT